jgi:hypothetical protein
MRLSLRFAMRCAVCPDACRIGLKIGIDFRKKPMRSFKVLERASERTRVAPWRSG